MSPFQGLLGFRGCFRGRRSSATLRRSAPGYYSSALQAGFHMGLDSVLQMNLIFRAANQHICSSIRPWRKREMLVSP